MSTDKDFSEKKILSFDPEKVDQAYQKLVQIFVEEKLTAGEIIIALGNLTYTLGASMEGYKDKGPSLEKLKEMYYTNPTLGVAMMLSGITQTSWYSSYEESSLEQTPLDEK